MLNCVKGFPEKVDAGYLQRFNIARANESYMISILKFLGLIDEEGNRVDEKMSYFYGDDGSFRAGLESTLRSAYSGLFNEMGGDAALDAAKGELAQWFRASDKTSDLVGQRQPSTFQTLAALAGHGEIPAARSTAARRTAAPQAVKGAKRPAAKKATPRTVAAVTPPTGSGDSQLFTSDDRSLTQGGQGVGLTVRIEVNLPPGGETDTYDAIFASIKKHLMS